MKRTAVAAALLLAASGGAWAQQEPGERPAGQNPERAHGTPARGRPALVLANAAGAEVTLWKPDLTRQPLEVGPMGAITVPPTGMDNYHAVVAEREWDDLKEVLIRYVYRFGRPSGHSPAELTAVNKTELEVVPQPIPREHHRYFSDTEWAFRVRFRGEPAADTAVTLETDHGSRLAATTDAEGLVRFRLPDDFPQVQPGRSHNAPGELAVRASLTDGGIEYRTALTAEYHANPAHWRSFPAGVAIAGAGFVAGGLLSLTGRNGKRGNRGRNDR